MTALSPEAERLAVIADLDALRQWRISVKGGDPIGGRSAGHWASTEHFEQWEAINERAARLLRSPVASTTLPDKRYVSRSTHGVYIVTDERSFQRFAGTEAECQRVADALNRAPVASLAPTSLADDPGRCANCGAPYEGVRPGKSQSCCWCSEECAFHGPGKIRYHAEGEVAGLSGYFCDECEGR